LRKTPFLHAWREGWGERRGEECETIGFSDSAIASPPRSPSPLVNGEGEAKEKSGKLPFSTSGERVGERGEVENARPAV